MNIVEILNNLYAIYAEENEVEVEIKGEEYGSSIYKEK